MLLILINFTIWKRGTIIRTTGVDMPLRKRIIHTNLQFNGAIFRHLCTFDFIWCIEFYFQDTELSARKLNTSDDTNTVIISMK
jgi:hypothetical protein